MAIANCKRTITLELSDDEATALSVVLRNVGGSPNKTRRGFIESIEQALQTLGICDRSNDIKGSIDFQEVAK